MALYNFGEVKSETMFLAIVDDRFGVPQHKILPPFPCPVPFRESLPVNQVLPLTIPQSVIDHTLDVPLIRTGVRIWDRALMMELFGQRPQLELFDVG